MSLERFLVRYSGRVQGVGFRAGARQLASGFKVGGWVKNLSDGSVEMLVSGEAQGSRGLSSGSEGFALLGAYIDRKVRSPRRTWRLKKALKSGSKASH